MKTIAMLTMLVFPFSMAVSAAEIELDLPIRCEPGKTCWVQQYVDHDSGPGVRDYRCGGQTYDGHDGTDIRIRDTTAKADVLASAPGVVKGTRDGMEDRLVRTEGDRAAIKDRECGNGVLIEHEGGWETQYCHLRQGSISVRKGDAIDRGQKLGEVGYSGMAAFPHVHVTVRKDRTALDPFRTGADADQCGDTVNPLWSAEALKALAYSEGDIIGIGFSSGRIALEDMENGKAGIASPTSEWPALVAYAWAINLKEGDMVTVMLDGPGGTDADNSVTLDRNKAQYLLFTGRKRPADGWPEGEYVARVLVTNGLVKRLSKEVRVNLPE